MLKVNNNVKTLMQEELAEIIDISPTHTETPILKDQPK